MGECCWRERMRPGLYLLSTVTTGFIVYLFSYCLPASHLWYITFVLSSFIYLLLFLLQLAYLRVVVTLICLTRLMATGVVVCRLVHNGSMSRGKILELLLNHWLNQD